MTHRRGFATKRLFQVAAVAGAIALGCSGDEEPRTEVQHPAAAALVQLQDAFADRDSAEICRRMTAPAQKQAGELAHGSPTTCPQDVGRAFEILSGESDWGGGEQPVVKRIASALGSRANAIVEDEDGWRAEVALARQDGAWKLAGFFGMPPAEFAQRERALQDRPVPGLQAEPAEALDGTGAGCPDVSDKHHPEVTGGCSLGFAADSVPIAVLSPFGEFGLGDCSVSYRASIARLGHGWLTDLEIDGEDEPRCSKIERCLTEENEPRPWTSRLVGNDDSGHFQLMEICLRTPAGLFAGEFALRLVREDDDWHAEPAARGVTGLRIGGELEMTGDRFDIQPPKWWRPDSS